MRRTCIECRRPVPDGVGYVAAVGVQNGGVLHRDQHGLAASYYGRVTEQWVRRGCDDPTCVEARDDLRIFPRDPVLPPIGTVAS